MGQSQVERYHPAQGKVVGGQVGEGLVPSSMPSARSPVMTASSDRMAMTSPRTSGDLQLRKNQVGLVESFAAMLRAHPELPHDLVLVGKQTGYTTQVQAAAENAGIGARVHYTGFVSDEDLMQLYGACDLFVFASFYEGFGIPILEAMACGRAVACSHTSAMREVADGAAILFDPYSLDEMTRAMLDLLLDSELRLRMERLGVQRAAQFSWTKSAKRTLEVYYEVAGNGHAVPDPVHPISALRP